MNDWKLPEDRVLPALSELVRRWQGRRLLGGREEVDIGAEAQTVRDGFLACRARAEAAERDNARLREALEEIARQKLTDELETEADVEYADFEEGYDCCIRRARAALKEQP